MRRPFIWAPFVVAALIVLIALVATACGGAEASEPPRSVATPASVPVGSGPPVRIEPVEPGGRVNESPAMPRQVARALAGDRVIVVAFLYGRAADDRVVGRELDLLRRDPAYRGGVHYFVYPVGPRAAFGDLPDLLGITGTPAVAVIGRDRTLSNRWIGLVDATMLRQAINDASAGPVVPPAP